MCAEFAEAARRGQVCVGELWELLWQECVDPGDRRHAAFRAISTLSLSLDRERLPLIRDDPPVPAKHRNHKSLTCARRDRTPWLSSPGARFLSSSSTTDAEEKTFHRQHVWTRRPGVSTRGIERV